MEKYEFVRVAENKVTCRHCGYSWHYKGNRTITTCPRCGYKVFLTPEKDIAEVKKRYLGKTKQVIRLTTDEDRLRLVPWGDVHVGAPEEQCKWELAKAHLNYILQTPNAYMIGMGDYADCAQKMSRRGPNVYTSSLKPMEQYYLILDALKPLAEKGKILGLHSGNHEDWIFEETGIDLVRLLCDALKVPYLGPGCDTTLYVNKQKYHIYSFHGTTSAKYGYTKMSALVKAVKDIFADVYLMGHVHVKNVFEGGRRLNSRNQKCYYVLTGHFLDWTGSYAQKFGYDISPAGCVKILFFADRKDIHVIL